MTGYEIDVYKAIIYYGPKISKSMERIAAAFEKIADSLAKANEEKEDKYNDRCQLIKSIKGENNGK